MGNNLDWKDLLGALKESGSLPKGEELIEEPQNTTDKPKKKETLHVVLDKKGRKGKTATIIEGLQCDDTETEELAKSLKQKLGTGGSTRPGEILIQGDRKKEISEILIKMGYKVKYN